MASGIYDHVPRQGLLANIAVYDGLKIALVKDTYTFNSADVLWGDISSHEVSGTGYTAGGETLTLNSTSSGVTESKWSFFNNTWTNVTVADVRYGVMYDDDVTAGNRYLAACFDFGSTESFVAEDLRVDFPTAGASTGQFLVYNNDNTANGITSKTYINSTRAYWLGRDVDFQDDNFKVALLANTYAFSTDILWASISSHEVSGGGYAAQDLNVHVHATAGSAFFTDGTVTFSGLTSVTFRYMVIYHETGGELVGYWDFGSDQTVTGDLIIDPNTTTKFVSFTNE